MLMFLIITSIVLTPNWFKFCSVKLENSVSEEFAIKKKKRKNKGEEKRWDEKIKNTCLLLFLITHLCVYIQTGIYSILLRGQNGVIFPEILVSVSLKTLLLNPFTPVKTKQRLTNQCDSWRARLHGNQISPKRRRLWEGKKSNPRRRVPRRGICILPYPP